MSRITIDGNEMAQRLQDIVGKLYRPPSNGTRQVFALSRLDAEKLPQLSSIAVISITAPERPPANIGNFAHVLRLSFADVDFLNPELSHRARSRLVDAFTEAQAQEIRSFIEALPGEIASVVVHCEGGYSRSCGVAVALHQLYGYTVEPQHLTNANLSIARTILGADRATRISKKNRR
ncbi:hypothetical protein [Burkholderia sola]|uniref:hypothetical protein n=1 Tax=Burkholderia sola TaxID=2843302 RepID=UPI001C325B7E|nr:hypothetical protein BCCR75389_03270 [Burkholderia cenocepacia]CAG2325083.1 hypothetical protein BCCR75587_03266 [Burkholderia cenocepacia]CAG2325285.1 hypothetical protein BCCR75390_03275 [Burkholderia cenocepacia]CAG2325544.1 hypothetical protein BCCR75588_03273 [Burkholderia cenocepacia]CAG2325886.1 hypothetical protein BCCR75501_03265 [Burkholderia cenocepacia]